VAAVEDAIRNMAVRGAPAIGIAAAYGVVLAARENFERHREKWRRGMAGALESLALSRPTAVNLGWALNRMQAAFAGIEGNPETALLAEAQRIHDEDVAANLRIGELGAGLLPPGDGLVSVLTHCNAGALATGGYGTALGVVRSLHAADRLDMVYVPETRPWLQGARLTAWELEREGVPVTLHVDSAAAALMRTGHVQCVIVGADRITANGDVINKIGTYSLAVLAREHGIPFMVAAPLSSVDPATASGADVRLEERDATELARLGDTPVAPAGIRVLNPVFDVTPAAYVRWIVTEKGIVEYPDPGGIEGLFHAS
jgi:methylthioribose-1-phosphate isomerase